MRRRCCHNGVNEMFQAIKKMSPKQQACLALFLILPAPLIGVSSSLLLPPIRPAGSNEIEIGKLIWFVAKIWLLLLPVAWMVWIDRESMSWSPTTKQGIVAGFVLAIPVSIVLFGTYWMAKGTLIDPDAKQAIEQLDIASPANFLIFALAMSLLNSLMEEYVWRWFVFTKLRVIAGVWPAILLSAFFFTVHHVVIMWNFGSLSLVLLGSAGLFSGGIIWAWLYNRYNSIWPGWICHVAADAAIMWITWWIITGDC